MTELTAPPIRIRAATPYWRSKDLAAPVISSFTEITVDDTSIPADGGDDDGGNNNGASGAKIYGEGIYGRRLWIYSPAGQWIRIPVGADNDQFLKSFNVYDKKKKRWLTAYWAGEITPGHTQTLDVFSVRAPGRMWSNSTYGFMPNAEHINNRNWRNSINSTPYVPETDGYVQFTAMEPRRDPTWRVVDILGPVPSQPPNIRLVNGQDQTRFDQWGAVNRRIMPASYAPTITSHPGYSADPSQDYIAYLSGTDPFSVGGQFGAYKNLCAAFTQNTTANPVTGNVDFPTFSTLEAGMIDLVAIRQQLNQRWPYSQFGQGVYQAINAMTVKRVTVLGYITFSLSVGLFTNTQNNPYAYPLDVMEQFEASFQKVNWHLYATPGAAKRALPSARYPYEPGYPDTIVVPQAVNSRLINAQTGVGGPNYDTYGVTVNGGPVTRTRKIIRPIQIVFDSPGEDNIAFYVEQANVDPANYKTIKDNAFAPDMRDAPGPYQVAASCTFDADQILIHYAVNGSDSPSSLRPAELNVGSFTA